MKKTKIKSKNKKILFNLFIVFVFGVIVGLGIFIFTPGETYTQVSESVNTYIYDIKTQEFNNTGMFIICLIKYETVAIVIWLMSFIYLGRAVATTYIFIKGVELGYLFYIMVKTYLVSGALYFAVLMLPQILILMPLVFFLTFCVFKYYKNESTKKKYPVNTIKTNEYFFTLVFDLIGMLIVSFMEAYFVPFILGKLI